MKKIKYNLLICFLLVFINSPSTIAQVSSPIDGKSYSVSLTPTGKNKDSSWNKDTFIFTSNEMYPQYMKKREGFKRATYSPINNGTEQEPIVKFAYENFNLYGSSLKIEGTATTNSIEGTASWIDDNGEHTYNFKGTTIISKK